MRWILLLAGFVVVLGIYLFGRYHSKREDEAERDMRPSTRYAGDSDPLFDQPGDNTVVEAELERLERLERLISEDTTPPPDIAPVSSENEQAPPIAPDKVVTLFVLAPTGVPFPGNFILEAMQTAGLQFGDMDIFHHVGKCQGREESLFSVANLVEPGTFNPAAMETFATEGLVLFLQLPGPLDPTKAFDSMVKAGQSLAESLGGTICDATRSALTNQTIGHMREDVIDYQLRQRVAKTAS
ncbi:MAG: cell division protein ZipA [Pseudomonadota bacterium]